MPTAGGVALRQYRPGSANVAARAAHATNSVQRRWFAAWKVEHADLVALHEERRREDAEIARLDAAEKETQP